MRIRLALLTFALVVICVQTGICAWVGSNTHIDAGSLKLDIYASETATLFHVVDQISEWSPYCHRQYVRYFQELDGGLSQDDKDLLAKHVVIRKKGDWGGLEPVFYTPLGLDAALAQGIKDGHLTDEDAKTERLILMHFKPRIDRIVTDLASVMAGINDSLQKRKADLSSFAEMMSRFTGCKELTIPMYLLASPRGGGGGGYNGGRLTLEVGSEADIYDTLVHELFHAFIYTKRSLLEQTAGSTQGLDIEKLSEGMAYAYSPGMQGDAGLSRLVSTASEYVKQGTGLDQPFVASNIYGLALCPLLKRALDDKEQTLETFLPKAADTWLAVANLHKAIAATSTPKDYRSDARHSIFVFGTHDEEAWNTLYKTGNRHLFGRLHNAGYYNEMFTKHIKPGDTIILLFSLDDPARIPEDYSDLLPSPWSDIENRLKKGQTVFINGKAREMTVFLLAAPTKEHLVKEYRRRAAEKMFIK